MPGDLARQAALARRAEESSRPLLPGERVDADTAGAAELARLPRVGPKLARRIVEERDAHGPFGSLEGLRRVSGIGPAMLAGLERSVSFSGMARPPSTSGATPGALSGPLTRQPSAPGLAPASGPAACPVGAVSLNDATARELECLKGVGPALAARIVAYRTLHGRFAAVDDLDSVPGVGTGLLERLRPYVRVP